MPAIGDGERIDIPPDLDAAVRAFVEAGRAYREFLKRYYPDRLQGVVWAECEGGEFVLFTESARFSTPIKETVIPLY